MWSTSAAVVPNELVTNTRGAVSTGELKNKRIRSGGLNLRNRSFSHWIPIGGVSAAGEFGRDTMPCESLEVVGWVLDMTRLLCLWRTKVNLQNQ